MDPRDLLDDAAHRPLDLARSVLDGLDAEAAHALPMDRNNSIVWLLWHAARQMDVQTAALRGAPTVWEQDGWAERLGVDRGPEDFGFGDSLDRVRALRVQDVPALADHLAACVATFMDHVRALSDEDLAAVVDHSYNPPVTHAVRLVSIVDDAAVHVGQAAYARGLVEGWTYAV